MLMNGYCRLCLLLLLAPAQLAAADEGLRLYQEHQRQTDQRLLEQRLRQLERGVPTPDTPSEAVAPADSRCWRVSGLQVSGNERLSSARISAAAAAWLHPCMGVTQINQVLKAITTLYLEAGYVASRPYLVGQPADDQPLEIVIVEGFVEAIEVSDPDLPLSLSSAFPGMLGEPLQLRELEQGMDQLNRLRVFDLTADVAPGEFEGGSRLLLQPRSTPSRWGLNGSVDNSGSAQVARHLIRLNASLESPAHLNDALSLSFGQSLGGPGASRMLSGNYQIPYGHWTLGADVFRGESDSLAGQGPSFIHGQLQTQGLSLNRTLWRDGQRIANGFLKWSRHERQSRYRQVVFGQQALELEKAEIGLSVTSIGQESELGQQVWMVGVSYAHGLKDTIKERQGVQPLFEKYSASLRWDLRGKGFSQPWFLNSQLNVQYSPDRLPDLEHLPLTGANAVRGFRDNPANTVNGIVWQSTLSLPRSPLPVGELVPFLGLDTAVGRHHPQDIRRRKSLQQRLASASFGATLRWQATSLRLTYQHALLDSHARRPEPGFWLSELSFAL